MPYYAVRRGRKTGIYNTWDECKKNVLGFQGSVYKKFNNIDDAKLFINDKINKECSSFFTKKKEIYVYTDGSCLYNGTLNATAGIGIYFADNDPRNVSQKYNGIQTNNCAELYAIIKTFNILSNEITNNININIYTDSEYAIKCATSYGRKCSSENWIDDIPNKKLVKKIYQLYSTHDNVYLHYVRAHTNNTDIHSINNSKADKLARNGASSSLPNRSKYFY